jgi:hypothetical protein
MKRLVSYSDTELSSMPVEGIERISVLTWVVKSTKLLKEICNGFAAAIISAVAVVFASFQSRNLVNGESPLVQRVV